jgi:Holliday junction resolvasome RuvABC endonuclease subunit
LKIFGIDYSVNSPAVVRIHIDSDLNETDISYLGFSDVKKTAEIDKNNIIYYNKKQFNNYIEKIYWFRDNILDFMKLDKDDIVGLESYAFCAKGKVFNIAEATFSIKSAIYDSGAKLRTYEPTLIKKFSTGKGTANKEAMLEEFNRSEYKELFGDLPSNNPKEDLVDAFYIAKLLLTELRIRRGLVKLSDLSEKQIEVFNATSKSNPENILVRDFLSKLDN